MADMLGLSDTNEIKLNHYLEQLVDEPWRLNNQSKNWAWCTAQHFVRNTGNLTPVVKVYLLTCVLQLVRVRGMRDGRKFIF